MNLKYINKTNTFIILFITTFITLRNIVINHKFVSRNTYLLAWAEVAWVDLQWA